MGRLLRQGQGWRLGWDAGNSPYVGLVGAEAWALELTLPELQDFCRLLGDVARTFESLTPELMPEERLTCEHSSSLIWLEAAGYPGDFDLRLLLLTGRRGEGYWPATAVRELLAASQSLSATNLEAML
ncbi:MAG: DUF1818 family protein [Gloeomargaritaceae cyanobacterium C42_A2020_066]|nr:DUF1818 family protein [Gloeomargaritaceae cyanobacterium C42_A2020_066]